MEAPFTPYTAAVGLRSVEKRIGRGEIASVYLAADADARLSHKVLSLCVEHHVHCIAVIPGSRWVNLPGWTFRLLLWVS